MLDKAVAIFDAMYAARQLDIAAWNAMIVAYVDNQRASDGLKLYWKLKEEAHICTETTYVAALSAAKYNNT